MGFKDLGSVGVLKTPATTLAGDHTFAFMRTAATDTWNVDKVEHFKAQNQLGDMSGQTYSFHSTFSFDNPLGLRNHILSGQVAMVVLARHDPHATTAFAKFARSGPGHVPLATPGDPARKVSARLAAPGETQAARQPVENVGNWPVPQRLKLLFEDMLPLLRQDLHDYVQSMLTGEALAALVAGILLMAGLQAIPVVGETADAALLGLAWWYAGWDGLRAILLLVKAVRLAATATTRAEIDAAAPDAARALETLGGDVLATLILRAAKRNTSAGGEAEVAAEEPKPEIDRNRGKGIVVRRPARKLRCFKTPKKGTAAEMDRQLGMQQDALNKMSPDQLISNMDASRDTAGKIVRPTGDAASRAMVRTVARKEKKDQLVIEYGNNGKNLRESKDLAQMDSTIWMNNQAALHAPDITAGGDGTMSGVGGRSENSSIGSQWNTTGGSDATRVQTLRVEAEAARARGETSMNIQLERFQ